MLIEVNCWKKIPEQQDPHIQNHVEFDTLFIMIHSLILSFRNPTHFSKPVSCTTAVLKVSSTLRGLSGGLQDQIYCQSEDVSFLLHCVDVCADGGNGR
ncbi:hypothetical protein H8959_004059 [Pygathrix nigripes]